MIFEPSLPTTRLRAMESLPGWLKVTRLPAPMSKLCQLIASLLLDWSMTICWALGWLMAPLPETTWPPVGRSAARPATGASSAHARTAPEPALRLRACSSATHQARRRGFQTSEKARFMTAVL